MANDIFVSDEYSWSASFGLCDWVLSFLSDIVTDQET